MPGLVSLALSSKILGKKKQTLNQSSKIHKKTLHLDILSKTNMYSTLICNMQKLRVALGNVYALPNPIHICTSTETQLHH